MPIKDLIGQRFGRLKVVEFLGVIKGNAHWRCECVCGKKAIAYTNKLTQGNTKSCGCLFWDNVKVSAKTHGMRYSRPYRIWRNMRSRCENPRFHKYPRYGGRGIMVCGRWLRFENFWEDMKKGYSDDLSIDRINNDGNYEPGNCRWATAKEQANNKS